ncbi:hypothetical protein AK830_g12488 [Neonectria ditissima]|uniref:Ig-like domain-containing protein n=1 Tax=Neonectria ditissima TaxID=78410 RepID=A0A0P7B0F6_9HYPO|nr:hypothetical protein AK830_g12488 [Neonectria ditissima]
MAVRRLGTLCAAASLCFLSATNALPSDHQKPINVPDEHQELPVTPSEEHIAVEVGSKVAKMALYPGFRTYPDDLEVMGKALTACDDNDEIEVIHLATDVCLSGEYYMRDNVKVLESPSCADGSIPTLMFYQNRRCTGSPLKAVHNLDETERCLWSEADVSVSPYYWSLIYRCDTNSDGAAEHQEATPAVMHQNVLGAPGSVRYHHGTTFPCHSDFANGTHTSELTPGNCNWPISSWKLETIEIVSPAVCGNGTRAQLALYEDIGSYGLSYMCNWGEVTLEDTIMDVDDWMLNTCINMSNLKLLRGGFGRALGVMFYCDGIHFKGQDDDEKKELVEETPNPRGPRTSHSECATSAGRYQWNDPTRPKTFMYPEPMACMALPKGHQVRIHEKPTCPDGSTGRLAKWSEPGCVNWPKKIQSVDTLNCDSWNLQSETSYMIWCAADGLTTEERARGAEDHRAVVSTDECPRLNMKPGWVVVGRDGGPTVRRIDPDQDCIRVNKDDQLKVYGNAKCPSGKDAKLAFYTDSYCRGSMDRKVDVASYVDTCTQVCREGSRWGCGVKFTCDG